MERSSSIYLIKKIDFSKACKESYEHPTFIYDQHWNNHLRNLIAEVIVNHYKNKINNYFNFMHNKKIMMIVGDWNYPRFVYNSLKDEFNIDSIIIDRGESKSIFLKRRIKRLGLIHVVGQLLFRLIALPYINFSSKNRIKEILNQNNIKESSFTKEKLIEVESINSIQGHDILKSINPDIVIIVTTRILSKKTLGITNAKFINIHSGITPLYRGLHGAYWALINNDKKHCGVTVHLVDEGIDTGGILYQGTIIDTITPKDNFMSYTILQLAKALPLLKKAVRDVLLDNIRIKESQNVIDQKLFYHPTLWFYLFNRLFKGVK